MPDNIDIVLRIFDKGSGAVREVTKSLNDLDKTSQGTVSRGLGGLQSAIGVGLKAAAGVGIAALGGLTAAIAKSVSGAADMEQGIANIQATMGLTAEETAQVKDLITDLGLDPKLKVTAVEAAEAIDMLGKNGLAVSDIMAGAARSTVLLANATGGDFKLSADLATDIMAQFNIEAANMDKAVNGIVGVTKSSKFGINDYALAVAQAGGIASSVGVEFDDFNTAIAAISPQFKSGSDAGTSFKTFLTSLVGNSNQARDAMRDLGLWTERPAAAQAELGGKLKEVEAALAALDPASANYASDLRDLEQQQEILNNALASGGSAFFDAEGNLKDITEITKLLTDATAGLSEQQINNAFSTIFGSDAMRAAFGLVQAGAPEIERLKSIIGDTSAEESAAIRMDTFKGALEIAQGVIETISLSIGDKFLPVLRPLVERFTEMAQVYGPMIIDFFGQFAEKLSEFIDGAFTHGVIAFEDGSGMLADFLEVLGLSGDAAQAVGQKYFDFVEAIKGFFTPLVDLITQFFSWKDVLAAVGVVIATMVYPAVTAFLAAISPAVAVFAGLVAASALLRTAWESDWLGIRSALTYAWDVVNGVFNSVAIKISWIVDTFRAQWATLTANNASLGEKLAAIWNMIKDVAHTVWQGIVTTVQILWPQFKAAVMEWATAAWEWLSEAIPLALEKVRAWGTALWQWITNNLPTWIETLKSWATAAWQWIADAVPVVLTTLGKWLGNIIAWLGDNLPNFLKTILEWGTALYTWIGNAIPNAINALADFIRNIREKGDGEGQTSFGGMVRQWAGTLWRWIVDDLIPAVGPAFMDFIGAMLDYGGKLLVSLGNLALELGKLLWQWIVDAMGPAGEKIMAWGEMLWGWIKENAPKWGERLAEWGAIAWEWISEIAIPEASKKLVEWGTALWEWVKDNAPKWGERIAVWAEIAWTWIRDVAIPLAVEKLVEWGTALWEWVDNNKEDWASALATWAEAAWTWIRDVAIPLALEKLKEWGEALWGWIDSQVDSFVEKFKSFGRDIIQGLRDGIEEKWNNLKEWFGGVWEGFISPFTRFFQFGSPSRRMFGYGQDIMAGLQGGVQAGTASAVQALTDAGKAMGAGIGNGLKSEAQYIAEQVRLMMERTTSEINGYVDYFTKQAEIKALSASQKIANAAKDASTALAQLGIDTSNVIGYGPNGELILEGINKLPAKPGTPATTTPAAPTSTIGSAVGGIVAEATNNTLDLLGGITVGAVDLAAASQDAEAAVEASNKTIKDFIAGLTDFLTETVDTAKVTKVFRGLNRDKDNNAIGIVELRETQDEIRTILADLLGVEFLYGTLGENIKNVMSTISSATDIDKIGELLQSAVDFRNLANFYSTADYASVLPTDARLTAGNTTNQYNITLQGSNNGNADVLGLMELLGSLQGTAIA